MSDPQDRAEQLDDDKIATTDDPAEELEYPPDEPLAVDAYGTTPAEARSDEPLDERVEREEPDDRPDGAGMRLVSPDEGAAPDEEPDAVASRAGAPSTADLSAEEAALHETSAPPMGDGDGYVEDPPEG